MIFLKKVLYHASSKQGMKKLSSKFNVSNSGDNLDKNWIYAINSQIGASLFGFSWDDTDGVESGSMSYDGGKPEWYFTVPKKLVPKMKKPCSMYTITDTSSFIEVTNGLIGEYRSSKSSILLQKEVKFKSAEACMKHFGVNIKVK